MIRSLSLVLLSLISVSAWAQAPAAHSERLGGSLRDGWRIKIDGPEENVTDEWLAFWKEIGKANRQGSYFTHAEMSWSGLSGTEAEAYSRVSKETENTTWVYLSVASAAMGPGLDRDLLAQQVLEDFEYRYYRNELAALVAEAEDAETYLSKLTYSTDKKIAKLNSELERNEAQKVKLEERLAENAQQKVDLEEELAVEQARRQQAQEDLRIIQERLNHLRGKLSNFTGNQ